MQKIVLEILDVIASAFREAIFNAQRGDCFVGENALLATT